MEEKIAYLNKGIAYTATKDFAKAIDCYEKWLEITPIDDEQAKGRVYARLGHVYDEVDESLKALECYEKAMEIAQRLSDQSLEVQLYRSLAQFYFTRGNAQKSCEYYGKEMELVMELDEKRSEELANEKLGFLYEKFGCVAKEIDHYEKAVRIAVRRNEKDAEALAYKNLGGIYQQLEDHGKSMYCYEKAVVTSGEIGDEDSKFYCNASLGILHLLVNDGKKAIECFKQCLNAGINEADDVTNLRVVYIKMAEAYGLTADFSQVVNCYQEWLKLATNDNELKQGKVYYNLGNAYNEIKDTHKAIECFEKSLELTNRLPDPRLEVKNNGNLGYSHSIQGNNEKAGDYYVKELELSIKLGDKYLIQEAHNHLSLFYIEIGDLTKAMELHENALKEAVETGDKQREASACGGLGDVYQRLGDHQKAHKFYKHKLDLCIDIGFKEGQAQVYCDLGNTSCKLQGKYLEAITYFEKGLPIFIEIGDKRGEAAMCYCLGSTYSFVGQYEKSIEQGRKCLDIAQEIRSRFHEGIAHEVLGSAFYGLEEIEKSIAHYSVSLDIAVELNDRRMAGQIYGGLGMCRCYKGELEEALELFNKQIGVAEEIRDESIEADGYYHKGWIYYLLRDYDQAVYWYEQELKIIQGKENTRKESAYYYLLGRCYGDMAMDKGKKGVPDKELMAKSISALRDSVNYIETLFGQLQEQDHLKISIFEQYIMIYNSLSLMLMKNNENKQALLVSDRGKARALNDLLLSKYSVNPGYHPKGNPISFEEIENMASNSSILFYSRHSLAQCTWIIVPGKLSSLLQKVDDTEFSNILENVYVDLKIREIRCEERLVETDDANPTLKFDEVVYGIYGRRWTVLREMTKNRCIADEDLYDERDTSNPLQRLYEYLISPVMELLIKDEIVIVPDGDLFKVPFAALRDPNSGTFLSETKRIRLVPSLTSLKVMQKSPEDFYCKTGALIIGNPKVGRVMFRGKTRSITNLPFAEKEAEMIGDLLGVEPLTGPQATTETIKQHLKDGVAVIHFAAHGTTNGEIFLAPSTTSDLPSEEDYILTMKDVQESGVRPQLVVLSCCHSGRGEIKAEGVVGMSRAFLAAGARAVVASLWAIADEATMEFMKRFYTHLKDGHSASKSLQQAMKEMRQIPRYSDPKFWAPFFLIGDDVSVKM